MTSITLVATEFVCNNDGNQTDVFGYTGDGGDLGPVVSEPGYQGDGGDLGPTNPENGVWRSEINSAERDLTRSLLENWMMADSFTKGRIFTFIEELTVVSALTLREMTHPQSATLIPGDDDLRRLTHEQTNQLNPADATQRQPYRAPTPVELTTTFSNLIRAAWRVASDLLFTEDATQRILIHRSTEDLLPDDATTRHLDRDEQESLSIDNDPLVRDLKRRVTEFLDAEDIVTNRDLTRRRSTLLSPTDDDLRKLVTEVTVTLTQASDRAREAWRRTTAVVDPNDGDKRDMIRETIEALDLTTLLLRSAFRRPDAEELTQSNEDEVREHTRPSDEFLEVVDEDRKDRVTERQTILTPDDERVRDLQRDNFVTPELSPDDANRKEPVRRTAPEVVTQFNDEEIRSFYRPVPDQLTQSDATVRDLIRKVRDRITPFDDDLRHMVHPVIEALTQTDKTTRDLQRRTGEGALLADSMERVLWRIRDDDLVPLDGDRRDATRIMAEILIQSDDRVRDLVQSRPELLEPVTVALRDLVRREAPVNLTPTADDRPLVGRYRPRTTPLNVFDDDGRDMVRITTALLDMVSNSLSTNVKADRGALRKDANDLAWVITTWANRTYAPLLHFIIDAVKQSEQEC